MSKAYGSSRALTTVTWLHERVTSGEWPLNSKIPTEPQLAEMLQVGRSTIREAVRTLANQGILETAPGRGTFVRARQTVTPTLAQYLLVRPLGELLELRRALEAEAAAMAAVNRTQADLTGLEHRLTSTAPAAERVVDDRAATGDFHADVMEIAGNPVVADMFRAVLARIRDGLGRGVLVRAPADERAADHRQLYECIAAGDVAGARAAAAAHCSRDIVLSTEPD